MTKEERQIKSDSIVKAATKIKKIGNKVIITRITKTISKIGRPIIKKIRKPKSRKSRKR